MDPWTTIGKLLQQPIASETDVYRLVQAGVPRKTFSTIERRLAIPNGVVVSKTTPRMHPKRKAARLTASESERLVGITRVFALADQLFGDGDATLAWMHHPAEFIPGRAPVKPIELAVLPSGARFLEDRIRRTQHGM
jgi:putative toxin-antitoxin system antitoxin component (TIGR02293 family)